MFLRTCSLALLLIALVASSARSARADDEAPRRPSLGETLTGDAKADYEAAKVLFEDGDFAGAASKFKQAHDRAGDPRLLWNMAVCEKGLRHYARVQALVARYLLEAKEVLSPEQERAAVALRQAVGAFVGEVKIEVVAGANVQLDGEPVSPSALAAPIALDLGSHKLSAEKTGFRPFVAMFNIKGGEQTTVKVALQPLETHARIVILAGEGDTISFDGKVVGVTRWQATILPGTHALRVTAPRHKPYELRVDLAAGANRTVDVKLENETRALWPWIAGGAVVVGAAVIGGFFLLRPDDKQAEQPTGTLPPGVVNLSGVTP